MAKRRLWLLVLILIALALRVYQLTYHSLWFDEAISVHWARQSVARILAVGFTLEEDRLPPLYYLTLKGWTNLFGFSETSLRLLSVFYGVLLVPVMASVARQLFNRRIAALTALLVALNPFLIWYAQEARMYAPAVLFSALSVWAVLAMIRAETQRDDRSRITPYAPRFPTSPFFYQLLFTLFATAALYSHLYAGFLLPALGLWLLLGYPARWRLWLRFGVSGLIITAAFAPLALAIWRFSGEAAPGDPFSGFWARTWWLLHAFTVWKAPLPAWQQTLIPAIVLLYAGAAFIPHHLSITNALPLPLIHPASRFTVHGLRFTFYAPRPPSSVLRPTLPLLLTTLLLITPFFIATFLLTRNYLAFFGERYFIVMVPWLLLLAAVGVDKMSRLTTANHQPSMNNRHASRFTFYVLRSTFYVPRFLIFFILLIVTLLPLPGQWSLPAAKEFWRQSVAYLAEHAAADHGLLIHPDWVRYPFQYYFQGPGQTYAAFSHVSPETALDGPLQGVVGSHPVIWLIQSHTDGPDPDRRVEQWFAARYPLVTELYPPGIDLKAFAPGYQLTALPATATPSDLTFANGLQLVGYQADRQVEARDEAFHPPSGWVHVTLYWTAEQPLDQAVTPFVHLVNPLGVWGIHLERANDALKLYPPLHWSPGTIIRHDLDINLNPDTPPGVYQLIVGLQETKEQYPLTEVEIR